MLKFVFWILLAANALVFAYGRGYLGRFKGNEHEPARLQNQVAPGKLKLVPASQARAQAQEPAGAPGREQVQPQAAGNAAQSGADAPANAPAAPKVAAFCTEVGSFGESSARRFEKRLAKLDLGEHESRIPVTAQQVTSYLVHIPPLGSKDAAERKVAELRGLGVENLFIMSGDSPLKWAISLGVFKSETAARSLQASLAKQGVRGARIYPRGPQATRYTYRFRDIGAATRGRIAAIAGAFDSAEVKDCR